MQTTNYVHPLNEYSLDFKEMLVIKCKINKISIQLMR